MGDVGKALIGAALGCVPLAIYFAARRRFGTQQAVALPAGDAGLRAQLRARGIEAARVFSVEDARLQQHLQAGGRGDATWALVRCSSAWGELNAAAQTLVDSQLQATTRTLWTTLTARATAVRTMS